MPVCAAWHSVMTEKKRLFHKLEKTVVTGISPSASTAAPCAQSFPLVLVTRLLLADLPMDLRKEGRFHFNYLCQIWLSSIWEDERGLTPYFP